MEQIGLIATDAGGLRVMPVGVLPRLEKAFARSAAAGMLDLVQHGLPVGAEAVLGWLRDEAQRRLMQYVRAERGAEAEPFHCFAVSAQQAVQMLESMPPLRGGVVTAGSLITWFVGLESVLVERAMAAGCTPVEWLSKLGEGWQQLGMLCFHLAENAGDHAQETPFAFLATFVHKVGADGKSRHAPLGMASRLCGEEPQRLAAVLRPLQQAAAENPFWQGLIKDGSIYRPCAWSARVAAEFLAASPVAEAAGIELRMVNLWKSLPPKVEVQVQLKTEGESKPNRAPSININSLLRFMPQVALGNHMLSPEEIEELLRGDDGLVRFRGEWVRLDKERVQALLNSWRQAARMAASGIPLIVGLRWLLGKRPESSVTLPPQEDDVPVVASSAVESALLQLGGKEVHPQLPPTLQQILRPYQMDGVRFLLGLTEGGFGACLADDMGLGKTLQVIAWLVHLHGQGVLNAGAALVVAPASLLRNWQEELAKFAPQMKVILLHPDALSREQTVVLRRQPGRLLARAHVALTTYDMATRLSDLLEKEELPALVLDEAQAIKNADSQRSRAVRRLFSARRVALSGTPVENSLSDLRALFDFLVPGLLGSEKEYHSLLQRMGNDYTPLRRMIRPFMLRRLKSDPALVPDLPPKTEQPAYCQLTPEQTRLYAREVESLRAVMAEPDPQTRLSLVLPHLSRLKQICNHPSQYLGESYFAPEASGKMQRLGHLARSIAAAGEACLVFTQYRSIIAPLHDYLAGIFGMPGLVLHGGTSLAERQQRVAAFRHPTGPPFFVLSLKAAGTGLTLTRARHVIHFDRWWNPAVENQAGDRAHRIGQQQPVIIHPLICRGTIEENIHHMLQNKQAMADNLFAGGLEKMLLRMTPEEFMKLL